jgi:hypothetical protein
MNSLTRARLRTAVKTHGMQLPTAFAEASEATDENGKGTPNDLRRYAAHAARIRSLPEHLAHVRAEDQRSARKFEGL